MSKNKSHVSAVLKSEAKEFAKTGNTYIVLVVVLLFVFLFFSIIMPTIIDMANISRSTISDEYRARMQEHYQNRILVLDERKAGGEGQLKYLESDRLAHEKYIFLVGSGTIEEDYFKLDNIYANYKEERAAVNMMFAADASSVILMLLAVLLVITVLFKGVKGTREKYKQAGIAPSDVTKGKVWLCQIVMIISFAALFVFGLILGAGSSASALVYSFGWRTINPVLAYVSRAIGGFILMQLMFFGCLAANKLMKSKLFGIIAPVVIYAFILTLCFMLIGVPFAGQSALIYIPFLSLQFAATFIGSMPFIISAVLHLAAAGGMAYYVLRRNKQPQIEYTDAAVEATDGENII